MDNNTRKIYPPGCAWSAGTHWSTECEVHGSGPCVPYPEMDDDDKSTRIPHFPVDISLSI